MRDPYVTSIHYNIGSGEGISYDNPAPLTFTNHLGAFELAAGKLTVFPAEHFSGEDEACQAIDPFLRAWEMDADLDSNIGMIRFKFERVELIDRDPPPPGSPQVIDLRGVASMSMVGNAPSIHLTCRRYPHPPQRFRATLEAQHAYRRWLAFRSGKEPLQSVAYFVLTLLEANVADRAEASRVFNIELAVLQTIGRLSSTRGDAGTARKVASGMQFQVMTGIESQWLERTVAAVVRRFGEVASGQNLPPIRMVDLPNLGGDD